MACRILVVKAEPDFVAALSDQLRDFGDGFTVSSVVDRREAMNELKSSVFDRIVTALKIPRISYVYLLLSHIAKNFSSQKVIVVVDEKSDEVERGLHNFGIKRLFSAGNVKGVLQALLEDGETTAQAPALTNREGEGETLSVERIQNALNWVMGPVGGMIFEDVASRIGGSDDLQRLVSLIANEIGEEKKITLFHQHLRR